MSKEQLIKLVRADIVREYQILGDAFTIEFTEVMVDQASSLGISRAWMQYTIRDGNRHLVNMGAANLYHTESLTSVQLYPAVSITPVAEEAA